MSIRDFVRDIIKECDFSKKEVVLSLVTIFASIPVIIVAIFDILSFFNIPHANDLLNDITIIINNVLNMYKNFNFDLKILLWSFICVGFTLCVGMFLFAKINRVIETCCREIQSKKSQEFGTISSIERPIRQEDKPKQEIRN